LQAQKEDVPKEIPSEKPKPTMKQRFIQAITPEKEFLPLKLTWWVASQAGLGPAKAFAIERGHQSP